MGWRDYVVRNEKAMNTVFEITRVYVTHVTATDEIDALAKESECERKNVQLTVKPIANKLSPETLAKIIEEAE